ncbi:hypothetical protein PtrSN002B_011546 [Pyrenophora tritici-repentis]|nr:hypothetical protein PtrSN002B_011546 [Pyrenophora tritici-repentis]PZD23868.1 hypothetical protein A1F96_09851 [Pyrenophora tritici-repentis]
MASHNTTNQTSWWPGYCYDDRLFFGRLQDCSNFLGTVPQLISEKNKVINDLQIRLDQERTAMQKSFDQERTAMLYKISTLEWKLSITKQKLEIAVRGPEISNGEKGKEVCRDGGAETTEPEVGPEQAKEGRSKLLEAERHKAQYQALEPKSQAVETESWQSARETVSPSVEYAPQQGQCKRKRKRAQPASCVQTPC